MLHIFLKMLQHVHIVVVFVQTDLYCHTKKYCLDWFYAIYH